MPVNLIQIREYECVKCGYKWINRKNGKDGSIPDRCAKCKQLDWDKGNRSNREKRYQHKLRSTVGEFKSGEYRHFWEIDANVDELLRYRPSIKDMKVIIQPMCYLLDGNKNPNLNKVMYDDRYRYIAMQKLDLSSMKELENTRRSYEKYLIREGFDIDKAREHQLQLSRQLVEYFLEKYSAPYQQTVVPLESSKK
jgi:hypothetical protein